METENYEITFWGLDPNYYTTNIIGDIWNTVAKKVYEETGVIIMGEVYDRYYVDPSNEMLSGRNIFTIRSFRIAQENESEIEYWQAYVDLAVEVKNILGNPRAGLITQNVSLNIFENI